MNAACSVPASKDVLIADLAPAQRAVWDALQEFCFNGPTCWPSQETLGVRTGYSLYYVNRIIGQLRRLELLTVTKARRGKWDHNVYTLAFWVPPLRKKTVRNIAWIRAEIARVRARLKHPVQTKGTPGAYSASDQRSTSVVSDLGEPALWSRARSSLTNEREPMTEACRHEPAITTSEHEKDIGGVVAVDDMNGPPLLEPASSRWAMCKHCGEPLHVARDVRRRVTRSWLLEHGYQDPFEVAATQQKREEGTR